MRGAIPGAILGTNTGRDQGRALGNFLGLTVCPFVCLIRSFVRLRSAALRLCCRDFNIPQRKNREREGETGRILCRFLFLFLLSLSLSLYSVYRRRRSRIG